jgi:hypothetical protein
MTSWATIAKRNIQSIPHSTTASINAGPARTGPARTESAEISIAVYTASLGDAYDKQARANDKQARATLEREEQSPHCKPTYIYMNRPDAPTVCPIFKTSEDQEKWMRHEAIQNDAYSNAMFERRMQEWRIKNNWQLPPMKTAVSKDEQLCGFYVSKDDDKDDKNVVKYVTPYSTGRDLEHEGMVNMMWCLIHSRADELVACKTVADFNALFEQTIRLEYPSYPSFSMQYGLKRIITPRKLLWLLSQKANVFPGKARHETARWLVDPTNQYPAPVFDPQVYTKSMVFFNLSACRMSVGTGDEREVRTTKPVFIVGTSGGRNETGICVVERLAQFGDEAKIRWLLSAQQLRKMDRVVFSPDCCPFRSKSYDSDDSDYW